MKMKNLVIFLALTTATLYLKTNGEPIETSPWQDLFFELQETLERYQFNTTFHNKVKDCKFCLEKLWEKNPSSRELLSNLIKEIAQAESYFKKFKIRYWAEIDYLFRLPWSKVKDRTMELEKEFADEIKNLNEKRTLTYKNYWTGKKEMTPDLVLLAKIYEEIRKEFEKIKKEFSVDDIKKVFKDNDNYWTAIEKLETIQKALNLISKSPFNTLIRAQNSETKQM